MAQDLELSKWAWIMDKTKVEREGSVTKYNTMRKLESEKRILYIIDTPGRSKYIKNMITGASIADAALLIVDSRQKKFEIGLSTGAEMHEQILLAFCMGVKQLIVGVNKMDDPSVNYS